MEYSPPRYDDTIVMHAGNFEWAEEEPGVFRKWVGRFTERDTKIGFVRLDAGATLTTGTYSSPEILFAIKGTTKVDGHTYPRLTAFGASANEGSKAITAVEASEFCCVRLPMF